jgi:hypothetical protein
MPCCTAAVTKEPNSFRTAWRLSWPYRRFRHFRRVQRSQTAGPSQSARRQSRKFRLFDFDGALPFPENHLAGVAFNPEVEALAAHRAKLDTHQFDRLGAEVVDQAQRVETCGPEVEGVGRGAASAATPAASARGR